MDASAFRLLEVAPVAIAVVVVIWHFRVERRAAAADAGDDARRPHA
jgi:hypothetical protein